MPLPKSPYTLHKHLGNDFYLVQRLTDGEILFARPSRHPNNPHIGGPSLELLLQFAGAQPAANLLNHENLISLHDEMTAVSSIPRTPGSDGRDAAAAQEGGEEDRPGMVKRWLIMDFAEAGTLQDVLDDYALPDSTLASSSSSGPSVFAAGAVQHGGFLPESFIWHVALGLLRALQWLHEGIRDTYEVVSPSDLPPPPPATTRGHRAAQYLRIRGKTPPEQDWMPVLHRGIRASNVFLQHPRGTETYGAVKLGGLERAVVSGSAGLMRGTPVVAMEGEDGVGLELLRDRKVKWGKEGLGMLREKRPYTRGNELLSVGAILYHMMLGRELPQPEDCDTCGCIHVTSNTKPNPQATTTRCRHASCAGKDINIDVVFAPLLAYTPGLKRLATMLLQAERGDGWWASEALNTAWDGFERWAEDTEDGRAYRDVFDDIWFRRQNQVRLGKRAREEEGEAEGEGEGEVDMQEGVLVV
ncbi:uncharacterized protein C8A04DRAFT_10771 [Dichotomopilus funicola]|uniref:non-specific serine/threonine protein kinase n=1 Tax=Dichotomopilus funicola TaxID=1934379 RepID=A0AAN6ZQ82_9PEZI|nr:hypothetical protein C8A04DRAFT_10771 [Dichotomopilus funicola]